MEGLRFEPVTKANWAHFERLFQASGGPKYCWCMAWRDLPNRETATKDDRRAAIAGMVASGTPVGILAYADDRVAGWCSVAPRETFRKLSPDQNDAEEGVWSITCFYVPKSLRRSGLAAGLLDAAVKHAVAAGARAVEAYPVDPDSPSYCFMGFRKMFASRGFRETGTAGSRRHVMRLERK